MIIKQTFERDVTYGNGGFYKEIEKPKYKFDIEKLSDEVVISSSENIPLSNESLNNLIFDPPFLTYIKSGRNHKSIMAKRFSGYYSYKELEDHYKNTTKEAFRLLKKNGIYVVKCQDIIHNHKIHSTHHNMINWCEEFGFRLKDLFILTAKHRMPANRGKQQHARIYHSYFLVFVNPSKSSIPI